ncbi:MAG TPA: hypothetical protein PJ987_09520 [Bacteroidia bacterium]|nr:hypothetical protein [Bacteroidia bacterium]HMY42183.1 hypothetical protein [Chitinophagales bacterium]
MATRYKSKQEIEVSEQKKLVRKNLKKIKSLMDKVETLFNELPNSVQNNMLEVHNPDYSVNHCVRWGGQAAEQLLEKRNMKIITKDL